MSIISQTYFTKAELELPIDNIPTQEYIDVHEPIILKKLLGYRLYKAFDTALADTPATKWTDLRDGNKEWSYNGITDEYLGIQQIIADYVYFNIINDRQYKPTTSGMKGGQTENAENAIPRYKQTWAWNDMVDRNVGLKGFILAANEADDTTYENYDPVDEVSEKVNVLNI